MSPNSDHSPYRNMVKSTTSPKMVPQKSSCNNLEVSNHNQYSKSIDSKLLSSKTMDSSLNKIETITSDCSKKINSKIQMATTITTTSYAYLEKSPESVKYGKYLKTDNIKSSGNSTPTQVEKNGKTDKFKNTATSEIDFRQTTKISKYDECKKKYEKSLLSSPQLFQNNKNVFVNDQQSNYGKILPAKCYDSYNANIQNTPAFFTRTDNYNNNNNYSNNNIKSVQPFQTNPIENYNDQSGKGLLRCSKEINRNMLRTNRYSNSNTNSTLGHQLSHVINSLSSPESAYSTGYSTDGTSPGIYPFHFFLFCLFTKIYYTI